VVVVAITGRRLGRTDKWPYSRAAVSPRSYLDAVTRAAGQPVVVNDVADPKDFLGRVDALVLSGGADIDPACFGQTPNEHVYGVDRAIDDLECELADIAVARGVPTLAICRGIQVLNVARGGTLFQHIPDDPGVPAHGQPGVAGGGRLHDVALTPGSLVADVCDAASAPVLCHHHQAIDQLGDGLEVTGRASDGIVEAIELPGSWVLAVQWHPEDTAPDDPMQQRLFDALVRRAGNG
jgi:putative glutamine amidotransferase